jgi:transcriptional regulator with PAS, ATPase and Fis domain
MKNILLSFCGAQDPLNKFGNDGPILSLITRKPDFHKLILFHTKDYITQATSTQEIIKTRYPQIDVRPKKLSGLEDATNHEQIFNSLRPNLAKLCPIQPDLQYYICVSSGTPAMHACWVMLAASGEIHAILLHKPDERMLRSGQSNIREINPYTRIFPLIRQSTVNVTENAMSIDDEMFQEKVKAAGIIGRSPGLIKILDMVRRIAKTPSTILIRGESGTGKELFAQLIHSLSERFDQKLITKNCSAIPESLLESELFGAKKGAFTGADKDKIGLFQAADKSTLFLDEIGEMAPNLQAKLLRVVQEKRVQKLGGTAEEAVDVRFIFATHKNLEEMVQNGQFRRDLYYRINVIPIYLQSLNDRRGDIPVLALHFLDCHNKNNKIFKTLSKESLDFLVRMDWKNGNIRHLNNLIERAVLLGTKDEISSEDFLLTAENEGTLIPIPEPYEGFKMKDYIIDIRRKLVKRALEKTGNNQTAAARMLSITPQAVSDYLKNQEGLD